MNNKKLKRDVRQFPIQHKFEIAPGGEVHSFQYLRLSSSWLPAGFHPEHRFLGELGPFYFRRLQQLAAGLIRVRQKPEEIVFELGWLGLALLRFDPPQITMGAEGGAACYPIAGGAMLQPGGITRGRFCFVAREIPDGLLLGIEVHDYHPRIVGSGWGRSARKILYTRTQAAVHHIQARDYLRQAAVAIRSGKLGSGGVSTG